MTWMSASGIRFRCCQLEGVFCFLNQSLKLGGCPATLNMKTAGYQASFPSSLASMAHYCTSFHRCKMFCSTERRKMKIWLRSWWWRKSIFRQTKDSLARPLYRTLAPSCKASASIAITPSRLRKMCFPRMTSHLAMERVLVHLQGMTNKCISW